MEGGLYFSRVGESPSIQMVEDAVVLGRMIGVFMKKDVGR